MCEKKAGLCWKHEICTKEKWYNKPKCRWEDGFQDFKKQETREKLRAMQFTCTSPLRFK